MRNRVIIILSTMLLVLMVACIGITPALWSSMVMADTPPTDNSGIMIVFYKIADYDYLFWCDLNAVIIDNGDSWDIASAQVTAGGVNKSYIEYDYFRYQPIPYGYNGTIIDLGLVPPTADDLPHSQHIGKLVDVDPTKARPATITRKWRGMTFDIQCLVSQTVVDMWVADNLNIGDYVIVSFIDEIPDTDEVNLAIVVDKVYESWGS